MLNLNKKAQVGETMTWIVATVVIIVILTITIYTSSALSKLKQVNYDPPEEKVDRIERKITFAYNIDTNNAKFIDGWIKAIDNG